MEQRKENGELQFKMGVSILPREELDRLNHLPTINGILSYERRPLEGNPYHGNLLLRDNTPSVLMKSIAASLVLVSETKLIDN